MGDGPLRAGMVPDPDHRPSGIGLRPWGCSLFYGCSLLLQATEPCPGTKPIAKASPSCPNRTGDRYMKQCLSHGDLTHFPGAKSALLPIICGGIVLF
jgi:hypothetical protein